MVDDRRDNFLVHSTWKMRHSVYEKYFPLCRYKYMLLKSIKVLHESLKHFSLTFIYLLKIHCLEFNSTLFIWCLLPSKLEERRKSWSNVTWQERPLPRFSQSMTSTLHFSHSEQIHEPKKGEVFSSKPFCFDYGGCSYWGFLLHLNQFSIQVFIFLASCLLSDSQIVFLSSLLRSSPPHHQPLGREQFSGGQYPTDFSLITTIQSVRPPASLQRNFTAATVCCEGEDRKQFLKLTESDAADNWVLLQAGNSRSQMLFA